MNSILFASFLTISLEILSLDGAEIVSQKSALYYNVIPDRPDLISLEKIPLPQILPGTVLIRNIISSINPVDYKELRFSILA